MKGGGGLRGLQPPFIVYSILRQWCVGYVRLLTFSFTGLIFMSVEWIHAYKLCFEWLGIRCINWNLGLWTFLMISVFKILLRSNMAVIPPVRRKSINQSNQSINPINQSIKSISQSINQSIKSVSQSNQSNQSINQISQSIQSINQIN